MTDVKTRIDIRRFETLGAADHGWLNARHHFSFADYYDPARMNWGSIRVWNDDIIQPQTGFPPHPHQDMEIITYVRSGAITHRDNLGNEGRTVAGDVQVMSAGSGIRHSEYNLEDEETRIFQIWIVPDRKGGAPSWGTKPFPKSDRGGSFQLLASGFEDDIDALPIRTPAKVLGAFVKAGDTVEYTVAGGRNGYLVPATGKIEIDGETINARDGVAMVAGTYLIKGVEESEIVLVDAA